MVHLQFLGTLLCFLMSINLVYAHVERVTYTLLATKKNTPSFLELGVAPYIDLAVKNCRRVKPHFEGLYMNILEYTCYTLP